jgi:NAD(P)H-quinone oxidoreductase subunit 6
VSQDVAISGGFVAEVRSNLRAFLVRLGVLALGLAAMVGAAALHRFASLTLWPTLLVEYLAVTCVVWGLNGFLFRRLPLRGALLLIFSAAAFGVLFLLAYFAKEVLAPFAVDSAGRVIGLVHLVDLVFYLFAVMTIGGAAGCAFSRNIIYSAWSLLFAFMGVAGLYVFLGADFPAVAQVLIYVGGILVLILFAIMLTKQIGEDPKLTNAHLALPAGAALAVATVGTLTYMAVMAPWKIVAAPSYQPVSAGLGIAFLTEYLLPFEVASVVLLAALIGAVIIARKEIKETTDSAT